MEYNVNNISDEYSFFINGVSYAGDARDNTMMYISKKVAHLVVNLFERKQCLVFVEKGVELDKEIKRNNCFIYSDDPQLAYAKLASEFEYKIREQERRWGYTKTSEGYYIGKNVSIGRNAYIEPGVIIGHNVQIGDDAVIYAGAVIKHAIIGKHFLCNENAVIGNYSFTMAEDEFGNNYRIPALGRVIIGDYVEIGACNDISMGACGDTILDDYVKLDGLVHVGHEAHLNKNTEITAGAVIAGFVEMGEKTYVGINSGIKNRIRLGNKCTIGMGSNVIKDVNDNSVVIGNPARPLKNKEIRML